MKKTFALLALVFLVVCFAPRTSMAQSRPCGYPGGPACPPPGPVITPWLWFYYGGAPCNFGLCGRSFSTFESLESVFESYWAETTGGCSFTVNSLTENGAPHTDYGIPFLQYYIRNSTSVTDSQNHAGNCDISTTAPWNDIYTQRSIFCPTSSGAITYQAGPPAVGPFCAPPNPPLMPPPPVPPKGFGCNCSANSGGSNGGGAGPGVGSVVAGNPSDVSNGNQYEAQTDYSGGTSGALQFVRSYNSQAAYEATSYSGLPRPLGIAWTATYFQFLMISSVPNGTSTPTTVYASRPDGRMLAFNQFNGALVPDGDVSDSLTATVSGYEYRTADNIVEEYDSVGRLLSVTPLRGIPTTLAYTGNNPFPDSVSDPFGHQLTFTYINEDGSQKLTSVTDSAGGLISYTYDTNSNLTSVTYPDSTTRAYGYGATGNAESLTSLTDESNVAYATWTYAPGGNQVIGSAHAGGLDTYSFTYNSGSRAVTDPLGTTRTYSQQLIQGLFRTTSADKGCAGCINDTSRSYDDSGNIISRADFNGNRSTYTYDTIRNLETSRTEALSSTGAATPRTRTITTQWDTTNRLPTQISVYLGPSASGTPLRTMTYTYDSAGNTLTRTITDPTVTPNPSRTSTYTYDSYNRLLTADGPRTDVNDITTYAYYTCTTGSQCGQLQTVTNAAGQVTTFNTYNAHGQPLTITDPNGVVTTLTYDLRQRLTSRQVGSETTAFAYWPTGLLKKVTLPDGSYLAYTYDGAHRLTQIADALGNTVSYTLDAMGNRTAENSYDPSNALHRTHSRVFNALSQLYQDVNAAGTAAVTTTFGYDANGNQTSIAAPLARNTANAYDELNRLTQITDPASGITQFGYDANDNLTSVTDPRNLATSYAYTGLGDLKTQASPDTGTTANTYDSGGNLATSTDARGAVSTYTYDALNRVTSVAYSLGGSTDQTISYTYDTGTNGQGHLTGASDANHALSWTYDALGRVTNKSQTIGSVTQSVGYGYTNADLTTLTTPSGQTVVYGFNGNHQVTSVVVNGTTVLNSVTYEPLGPINGWTWGNGTTTTRTYDTDGKISQIVSAGTKTFTYDNAFRITGITDTSTGAANWTYGYDALDRITSGTSPSTTRGWTYDANGNRQTETGSAASTYTIAPASNQITSVTGALARTYAYDAAGNTTSYSTVSATYNNAGRLKTLTNGSATETSLYNALGQRIKVSGGATGTVLYTYDEAGHLLGEYDVTGTLIEETVWLGDIPIATLRPSGSTIAVYYVHSDQLNTPRQVTRPSDNTPLWTWNSDPFGTDAANANPSGAGAFAYNLRLPGQIFDGQAGLHQNYFRDYDPATGRYVESDPIGLKAGVNTYLYVDAEPISVLDRSGLAPATLPLPPNENVTCCDSGQIAICMNHPANKNYKCKIVQDAMILHEMTHVNDFRRFAPSICAKFSGKQSVALGFTTYTEQIQSELRAFNAQRDALNRAKDSSCLSPECRKEVDEWLDYITNQAIPSVLNQTYGQ